MDPRYDSFQKAGNGRTRQPLNELSNYICFSFVRKQKKNDVTRVLIILIRTEWDQFLAKTTSTLLHLLSNSSQTSILSSGQV